MTTEELEHLAREWIAFQHSWDISQTSPKTLSLEWTYDAVDELLKSNPRDAWKLILTIHSMDQSEPINGILSAQIFEDFMELNGPAFIEKVEAEVQRNPSFARIVAGIYKARIRDDVWVRLMPLAKRYKFE